MKREKRRAPRAKAAIPLEICSDKDVFEVFTRDISMVGTYLTLDRFIPLNTKLKVTILLPGGGRGGETKPEKVTCCGIVVRNEEIEEAGERTRYGVAIHFTDFTREDKEKLAAYLKHKLAPDSR